MTLYIVGPITGFPGYAQAFADAKTSVQALGHEPISPVDLYPGQEWELAMQADIPVLLRSDGIVLLPGWPRSRGARIELSLAMDFGKRVFMLVKDELIDVTHAPLPPARYPQGAM